MYSNKSTGLAGNMSINITRFFNEDVLSYMATLISNDYLPDIRVLSCILDFE